MVDPESIQLRADLALLALGTWPSRMMQQRAGEKRPSR